MKKILTIALACLFLSGCAQRLGDFTVISTSNIDLNGGEFVTGERIEGQDIIPIVILPIGIPNIESAVEDAVYSERNNCIVGLENVTLTHRYFALIFGFAGYEIEGNAIYDTSRPNCVDYVTK
ncbi:hypothetical protein ACCH70_004378 [Vibrio vulnificus]|uniref:hypothetical protein n=1 Tax=Vibrio harveyi group TaxID=717610 RepID=UPI00215DE021|nr:hypothetical protein [Vibrio diabolicus]MCS0367470.1 hypothetical protein [Vibrio diabolicus]